MDYRTLVTNVESKPDNDMKVSLYQHSEAIKDSFKKIKEIAYDLDTYKKSIFYRKEIIGEKYIPLDELTDSDNTMLHDDNIRLLHGIIGLGTEIGEIVEAYLEMLETGQLDDINLKEELGDLNWYLEVLYDVIGTTREEVVKLNMDKLTARYGDSFSSEKALNRDLDKERNILES